MWIFFVEIDKVPSNFVIIHSVVFTGEWNIRPKGRVDFKGFDPLKELPAVSELLFLLEVALEQLFTDQDETVFLRYLLQLIEIDQELLWGRR